MLIRKSLKQKACQPILSETSDNPLKTLLLAAVFGASLVQCGLVSADDTEIYFAKALSSDQSAANVMFMFDTSGSMSKKDNTGTSRIDRLKAAMIDVVESADVVNVGIGSFNGSNRGGAIKLPAVGVLDDLCVDAQCTELKFRAEIKGDRDDGKVEENGTVTLNDWALPFEPVGTDPVDNVWALRFDDLNIPRGATINSARLQFSSSGDYYGTSQFIIAGEAVDDSAPLNYDVNDMLARYLPAGRGTSARVVWDVSEDWYWHYQANSPDLGGIISEITGRAGWCGGNALTLLVRGDGARGVIARDSDPWKAPVLQFDYDPSSVDFDNTCMSVPEAGTISNGIDDVVEDIGTGVVTGTADLIRTHVAGSPQIIGLRFADLDIPAKAVITDAYLQLNSAGYVDGQVDLSIQVEDATRALAIDATQTAAVSSRTFSSVVVPWDDVPAIPSGSTVKSPDISALISEVTSVSSWNRNNAALLLTLTPTVGSTGERFFSTVDSPADSGARLIVSYQRSGSDFGGTPPVLKTGRDEVIRTMMDLTAEGGTPLVDAYFEATQYMRGAPVYYGLQRGSQSSKDRVHRLSVPSSYTGADSIFRPPGCTENDLSNVACINEKIVGTPDYIAPPYGECKANQIILLSDGNSTDTSSNDIISSTIGATCAVPDRSTDQCGVELAHWMYTTDHDPLTDGVQSIITHTVGFNISSPFLAEVADAGGGSFFEADSSAELTTAFNAIIQSAIPNSSSFVAPTTSLSLTNRLVSSDELYYSMFKPSTRTHWDGNLKRFQLAANSATGVVEVHDSMGMPATNGDGIIKDNSKSYWSDSVDGNEVEQGGAASQLTLTRKLYTSMFDSTQGDITLQNFHEDNAFIDSAVLGLQGTDAAYRTQLLQWARGVDVKDYDDDGNITEVRAQMGDPLHSSPFILNYASDDVNDDTPQSLVFVGTNHGFLHAINTNDGSERFAYIPEQLLRNLDYYFKDLPIEPDQRPYGLDGEISGWHNDLNDNGIVDGSDTAYIYVGMRRGGRHYYALDVTDPDAPEFLWMIEGGAGDFAELAQSWSRPVKTKVKYLGSEKDVLFFAAGYDDTNDTESARTADVKGRGFFMVDAATGAYITSRGSDDFSAMKYSMPSDLRIINPDGDDFANAIYVGDTGGQVWRFDINNSATTDSGFITGTVLADFGGTAVSQNRKFFYEPDIALIKGQQGEMFLNIAIGSGSRPNPNSTSTEDAFYSFRDSNIFGPPRDADGAIAYATTLVETDLVDASTSLGSADVSGDLSTGWYLRLPSVGEKSLSAALTVNNQLYFTTYVPSATSGSVCSVSIGGGRVYTLDVLNGDPANGSEILSDRYAELEQPGIPSRVVGMIAESAPDVISTFVGLEAIGDKQSLAPFERIFWAEQ